MPTPSESRARAAAPPRAATVAFVRGVRQRGLVSVAGDLWREHGDVFAVRIAGRQLIFLMHPDAVEHVTVSERGHYDKTVSYRDVAKYLTGDGLVTSTGELWRRQRKLLAPFFTPRGIRTYTDLIIRDAAAFADRWDSVAQSSGEVAMPVEMTQLTASIILRALFSSESPESIAEMKEAVETLVAFIDTGMIPVRMPLWVPTAKNRSYLAARDLVRGSIERLIAQRRGIPEADWPDDLLSRLLQARDPETGEEMTESLVRDESITAFFAGHETTAGTLTHAWYALARNPEVAQKLHDELDGVLGDRPVPTEADLHALPYTMRVIKETMRLYPAAPFFARDAVADDRIGDVDVPRGAIVMISPFHTHRHPGFWDEPERFDPDRWAPEAAAGRHPHAYLPFSAGPRVCIGNNFSLLESHVILATLAHRFSPRLPPGYEARFIMRGTLEADGGLPMTIERRHADARGEGRKPLRR